ncbi:unnamed protein product [Trichobilharzia regenti]|nr:unnamed protein product [Trichobilharzia regenti]
MFSVDKYSNNLTEICKQRGIHYNLTHNLVEVNPQTSEAVFENMETKKLVKIKVRSR